MESEERREGGEQQDSANDESTERLDDLNPGESDSDDVRGGGIIQGDGG